jgi:Scavenger mRNA decapping enzyme C-term binding
LQAQQPVTSAPVPVSQVPPPQQPQQQPVASAPAASLSQAVPAPPDGIDYSYFTDCVQLDQRVVQCESKSVTLVSFEEENPQAALHALIIPMPGLSLEYEFVAEDIIWLQEMKRMAEELIARHTKGNVTYRLLFSKPGEHNKIPLLCLHVLAPLSKNWSKNELTHKFSPRSDKCYLLETVLARLGGG